MVLNHGFQPFFNSRLIQVKPVVDKGHLAFAFLLILSLLPPYFSLFSQSAIQFRH
jgi:hypothetical protein